MGRKAKFVTFEGTEGSGKTTQIQMAAKHFDQKGLSVLTTREPGGTELGNQLRDLLLRKRDEPIDPKAELLLIEAARAQHVAHVLKGALSEYDLILCDRYADASIAYQGAGRGLSIDWVESLNKKATDSIEPDLTFLLDLSEEISVKRALGRMAKSGAVAEDRFEREELDFHRRVREAYLNLARKNPHRFRVIQGDGSKEAISKRITKDIEELLKT